jgi:hypothetical protein
MVEEALWSTRSKEALTTYDELAEVFASHSFIHAAQGKYLDNALRSLPRTNTLGTPSKMLQELSKQLGTANQPGTQE